MAIHFSKDELTGRISRATRPAVFIRVPPKDVHPLASDSVMLEDIYACEAVQNGMGSPIWESALTLLPEPNSR